MKTSKELANELCNALDEKRILEPDQLTVEAAAVRLVAQEARIAELTKDAERYRWLRDEAQNIPSSKGDMPAVLMTNSRGYAIVDSDNFPSWLHGDGLDALIDAAKEHV